MLMQRRLAAKKKGRKVKSNRCHVKDGHLRCQAKQPMTKADTATFYKTMFGLGEEGTETEPVEEDVEEEEVLVEVLRAAPEGQQKSVQKKRKENQKKETKKKEKKRKSAVRKDNEEIVETKNKKRRRMLESAEDQDTEAAVPSSVVPGPALDSNGIGDEEAARAEDTETQEAAGTAVRVEETAPSRPEEDQRETKKSAQEEGEKEAAPAPVE